MRNKSSHFLLSLLVITVAIPCFYTSCASEKSSPVSNAYHNTTSHYNGYWYARQNINMIEKAIEESVENDYDQILPLFPSIDTILVKTYQDKIDEAIKMASLAIQRHPNSKWEDDSYLLVGMARLYSLDFVNAITTFMYINTKSEDDNTKHAALVQLLKTYTDYGEYSNAVAVSDYLKKEPLNNENLKLLYLYRAYFYQLKGDLNNMLESLALAAPILSSKDGKGRIYFIVGQNYQELGFEAEAYSYYKKCIATNPPYELDFHARLKMAQVTQLSSNSNIKNARKLFQKLLDDKKNKEFRDKIYYEMAEFEMRNKNLDLAIQYYNLSVREDLGNQRQRGLSYLKLGRIYYDSLKDYKLAKLYYDSTMTALPNDHEEYPAVSIRQKVLADFVAQLSIIEVQDSLLTLSTMDTAVLRKYLTEYVEAEQLKKEAENESKKRSVASRLSSFDTVEDTGTSSWYFGNLTAVAIGQSEFKKVWGDVQLTDYWRRSVKESVIVQDSPDGSESSSGVEEISPVVDEFDLKGAVDNYISTVPYSEESKKEALDKIELAFFTLGNIYYFDLKESENSAVAFETLLQRFADTEHKVEAMYLLYLIYTESGDSRKDKYRATILDDHPNSIYAKLILNPNYSEESSIAVEQLKILYEKAYIFYSNNELDSAKNVIKEALADYDELKISARFKLLKVLIVGKTEDISIYQYELSEFVKAHPDSDFTPYAETLLAASRDFQDRSIKAKGVKFIEFFEQEHYVIIAYGAPRNLTNTVTKVVDDFNMLNYKDQDLKTSNLILDKQTNFTMISQFPGAKSSLSYYEKLILDPKISEELPINELEVFTITKDNFTIFYQTKELKGYLSFFKTHY